MLKSHLNPSGQKILFLLSGSIACFKSCSAISQLVKEGHEVQTAVTAAALKFIGVSTLEGLTGKSVFADLYQRGHQMDHIHLARWADILVLAPATATTLARLAHGAAVDPVSCLALANNFKKPLLIAPALNTEMANHPATRKNVEQLRAWGAHFLEGEPGTLACGEYGTGRLVEPARLVEEIYALLRSVPR